MGTVHTVAVHFRYDSYMRRLANEFLCRNPIRLTKHTDRDIFLTVVVKISRRHIQRGPANVKYRSAERSEKTADKQLRQIADDVSKQVPDGYQQRQ